MGESANTESHDIRDHPDRVLGLLPRAPSPFETLNDPTVLHRAHLVSMEGEAASRSHQLRPIEGGSPDQDASSSSNVHPTATSGLKLSHPTPISPVLGPRQPNEGTITPPIGNASNFQSSSAVSENLQHPLGVTRPPRTSLAHLSDELLVWVFTLLDLRSLGRVGRVCKHWYYLHNDPMLWWTLSTRTWPHTFLDLADKLLSQPKAEAASAGDPSPLQDVSRDLCEFSNWRAIFQSRHLLSRYWLRGTSVDFGKFQVNSGGGNGHVFACLHDSNDTYDSGEHVLEGVDHMSVTRNNEARAKVPKRFIVTTSPTGVIAAIDCSTPSHRRVHLSVPRQLREAAMHQERREDDLGVAGLDSRESNEKGSEANPFAGTRSHEDEIVHVCCQDGFVVSCDASGLCSTWAISPVSSSTTNQPSQFNLLARLSLRGTGYSDCVASTVCVCEKLGQNLIVIGCSNGVIVVWNVSMYLDVVSAHSAQSGPDCSLDDASVCVVPTLRDNGRSLLPVAIVKSHPRIQSRGLRNLLHLGNGASQTKNWSPSGRLGSPAKPQSHVEMNLSSGGRVSPVPSQGTAGTELWIRLWVRFRNCASVMCLAVSPKYPSQWWCSLEHPDIDGLGPEMKSVSVIEGIHRWFVDERGSAACQNVGEEVVFTAIDKSVRIWRIDTKPAGGKISECDLNIRDVTGPVYVLKAVASLLGIGTESEVSLWDWPTGSPIYRFCQTEGDPLRDLFLDEEKIVTCGSKSISLWKISSGDNLWKMTTRGDVVSVEWSGAMLVTIGEAGKIWMLNFDPQARTAFGPGFRNTPMRS